MLLISAFSHLHAEQAYTLQSGDKIFIKIANETEFTQEITLNNTCSFNYPYLGTVDANGLTAKQLEQKLLRLLKPDYLTNPDISVSLSQHHGIFVIGEVENPGQYPFKQNLTAEQAIAIAGGFSPRANTKKVWLIKAGSDEAVEAKPRTALTPGDTVKVKKGSVFF